MGGSTFIGRVVSNRMQKTVVVAVGYVVWVPKYKVYEKRIARHMAHDQDQTCAVGDLVRIQTCRKLSPHKSYKVAAILRRAPVLTPQTAAAAVEQAAAQRARMQMDPVVQAEQRLAAAQQKLDALRKQYQQHLIPAGDLHLSSVPQHADNADTVKAQIRG